MPIDSTFFADSFTLPEKFDDVQSVQFSCNVGDSQKFVVTAKNGVVFGEWVSSGLR